MMAARDEEIASRTPGATGDSAVPDFSTAHGMPVTASPHPDAAAECGGVPCPVPVATVPSTDAPSTAPIGGRAPLEPAEPVVVPPLEVPELPAEPPMLATGTTLDHTVFVGGPPVPCSSHLKRSYPDQCVVICRCEDQLAILKLDLVWIRPGMSLLSITVRNHAASSPTPAADIALYVGANCISRHLMDARIIVFGRIYKATVLELNLVRMKYSRLLG